MSYLKQFTKILRGSLTAKPSSTHGTTGNFTLPLRKLVLRYSQTNPSSSGTRAFLLSTQFSTLTSKYASVEFVVSQVGNEKHPLVTGFYANLTKGGKQKNINLANLDANQVEAKLKQVIESSGARIKSLKRTPVVSKQDSARGIWSQLHDKPVDL
ncbi:related to MRPL51 - mitochondrial ribosomal protein, large subunit [Melanopsichium pennsylvanicum]|uniref:Large ribosomal subunit protein mL43 n=1 Tax=Melanopsichium pennsylvanicum TaxID=63383 RepID=A0AAJ4XM22_9BASI|nr:related to MRPL51 - mitochondrial ribosomal protein, large subunit [Melanopsichium pennsylvanicum]